MSELQRVMQDFEDGIARAMKPGDPHTIVSITLGGAHVLNPPEGSGFVHAKHIPSEEAIRLAKAYMAKA